MAAVDEPVLGGWTVSENSEITDHPRTMPDKKLEDPVDTAMTDKVME